MTCDGCRRWWGIRFVVVLLLVCAGCATRRVPCTEPLPVEREPSLSKFYQQGEGARAGHGFDLNDRNPNFPGTYISAIHIDVTPPGQLMRIDWAGPGAAGKPTGPFRTSPGRGFRSADCDCVTESRAKDTFCTPKGTFFVGGFADHLFTVTSCHYATFFHVGRGIAIHSHEDVPNHPSSAGCVRTNYEAAKLIHNNSRAGITTVTVSGHWKPPPAMADLGR